MIPWQLLLGTSLLFGLALSAVLALVMTLSVLVAPDVWLNDYPPDVRAKFGPMSPRASRLRRVVAVPFFLAVLIIPLFALSDLARQVGSLSFAPAFLASFGVLFVFNVFDLLVVDWLIFCTVQPRRVILPGTEGMPGYQSYLFHFVAFVKGLAFCAVVASLTSLWWLGWHALLPGP